MLKILKKEIFSLTIKKLNVDFDEIKSHLEVYLSKLKFINKLNYSFYIDKAFHTDNVENILILNFNYTKFIENYTHTYWEKLRKERLKIISIHGEINNPRNPIIFGYGDEKHPDYNLILNSTSNSEEYLKNVKHYKYLQTKNYDRLIEFLDKGKFDVEIFGHSCGNSDRTLLNEIFEHKNIIDKKGIHIYKRGNVDESEQRSYYNEVVIQLSRVLNNSADVRKKVRNFEDSEKMFCVI